ncbi:MAG: acetoacetate--CoA ligase [Bacteroidota bacterium]
MNSLIPANELWQPDSKFIEQSTMWAFKGWLQKRTGEEFPDYQALWQWSVDHVDAFWGAIWEYFAVKSHSPYEEVLKREQGAVFGVKWFGGATLNYAEHIFRQATTEHPALKFASERHTLYDISWEELRRQVRQIAHFLRESGVGVGDRVVSYLPNIPQALVAFLATNAVGAVWSSCSPDFGTASVVERFQQIEPKVLFGADGYSYNGRAYSRMAELDALKNALPTVEQVVLIPYLAPDLPTPKKPFVDWRDIMEAEADELTFTPVPFSHPIWVLYSSGTTGKPKAITHSVGGVLLEHFKALSFHHNVKPGDRFFWYSTTGWMMWNYANAALLVGATVVLFDGAAAYPQLDALWQLGREAEITHFGGGAAYYIACMKEDMDLQGQLPHLQSIGSTGSPLPPEAFRWLYEKVKSDMWLVSLSGGTDVCSGFVGGSPFLPVYEGEIQCRMLGCKVEALDEAGEPVIGEVGEMVISEPMPSMPIYFWGDNNHSRYRSSYFDMYPGRWRHGDWIRISEAGTLVIFGRSDATLNRGGVRIGTSEVYRAVDSVVEVADSLVVSIEREGGSYYMPLYVVVKDGFELSEELIKKIKTTLRTQFSPRHVPDEIIAIPEIPYTISGKKMETPVKKILMGIDPAKAVSRDAMKNPEAIEFFMER